MTFQITVQPSGHHYDCDADETVLAAAIRSGIGLPYGCKNGACGSCKGKVVEGSIQHRPHQAQDSRTGTGPLPAVREQPNARPADQVSRQQRGHANGRGKDEENDDDRKRK